MVCVCECGSARDAIFGETFKAYLQQWPKRDEKKYISCNRKTPHRTSFKMIDSWNQTRIQFKYQKLLAKYKYMRHTQDLNSSPNFQFLFLHCDFNWKVREKRNENTGSLQKLAHIFISTLMSSTNGVKILRKKTI